MPLIPINNVPSDDVPDVCVTHEETNTNYLIGDTRSVVSSDVNMNRYQLPPPINQGKAPTRYSLDNPKAVKYPIAHNVSSGHFPRFVRGFVNQMSSIIDLPDLKKHWMILNGQNL